MPPTRRSRTSGGPLPKGSQGKLPFNRSITKPSPSSSSTLKDKDKSINSPTTSTLPIPNPSKTEDLGHVSSEAAVLAQAKTELQKKEKTAEELRAEKVTDAQIKRYWREREAERRAPRVHQKDVSVEERILRLFDMTSQYGPCIGIARMKRWVRANKLGLAPPIEVLAVLLKEEEKGNRAIERAHVDELMNSKAGAGEA